MFSDYHVHSRFSFDSDADPKEIIERAISLNMASICFTDHNDYDWPVKGEDFTLDVSSYVNTIRGLADEYTGKIDVKCGIEMGFTPENACKSLCLLSKEDFDFVIGSCHVVDKMDPYYKEYWQSKSTDKCYRSYFEALLYIAENVKEIDALGHLDYIYRYDPDKSFNPEDYRDIICHILEAVIRNDTFLEINTSPLSKGFTTTNPMPQIIGWYKELGGRYVTVGSDAHKVCNIGLGFDEAKKLINQFSLKVVNI